MKLAILGAVVAAAGAGLGVDGLVYAGGLWIAGGLSLAAMLAAIRSDRTPTISESPVNVRDEARTLKGSRAEGYHDSWWTLVLTLVIGLGSLAIGIFALGFEGEHGFLRWLPVVVGGFVTSIGLASIPVRRGNVDL